MNIKKVILNGKSPEVSSFIDSYSGDVSLEISKDLSNQDDETYEVSVSFDPEKVSDPIVILKKDLPDTISIEATSTQSDYSGYCEDLSQLKDSVPGYISFDYFPSRRKILGEDLLQAVRNVRDMVNIESDSVPVNSFLHLSLKMVFNRTLPYTKFNMRNQRDMSDLYKRACQDLMYEGQSDKLKYLHILHLAIETIFNSVHKGKVELSQRSQSKDKFEIHSSYNYNKPINSRVGDIDPNYPKTEYFVREVEKVLDGISKKSVNQISSFYYDAIRETRDSDPKISSIVDRTWERFKLGLYERD